MYKHLILCACPTCKAEFGTLPEKAGHDTTCNYCNTTFPIPVGIQPKLVSVGTDPGRPLTREETAAFYASYPQGHALVSRRAVPSELVPEPYERMPDARYPVARQDDEKPLELVIGNKFRLKTDLDAKTRSSVFSTVVGGLLVAIGAIIAAKFGIKSKT